MALFPKKGIPPSGLKSKGVKPEDTMVFTRPRFKTAPVHPNTSVKATQLFAPPPDRVEPRSGKGTTPEKAAEPDLGQDLIPVDRYISRDFMEAERDGLWQRSWLMACRESDLQQPGDYRIFSIGRESVLIVRQWDDSIRAFFNVSPHRGNRLLRPDSEAQTTQRASSFVCPFHHWEWDVDGTLKAAPDAETFPNGLPNERMALRRLHADTWAGWVFVNMNPKAEPLDAFLEILPQHLDCYCWEHLIHTMDKTVEWSCNWKTAMDLFAEVSHVKALHPQLLPWTEDYHVQIDTYGRHSRMLIPFYVPACRHEDQSSVAPETARHLEGLGIDPSNFVDRPAAARRAIQKAKREIQERAVHLPYRYLNDEQLSDNYQYTIFPNIVVNAFADYVLLLRLRPHESDPERCYCDVQTMSYANPQKPLTRVPHSWHEAGTPLGTVLDQKAAMMGEIQAGLSSAGFEGLYLSDQERRIRHFHAVLSAYLSTADQIEGPAPDDDEDEDPSYRF